MVWFCEKRQRGCDKCIQSGKALENTSREIVFSRWNIHLSSCLFFCQTLGKYRINTYAQDANKHCYCRHGNISEDPGT